MKSDATTSAVSAHYAAFGQREPILAALKKYQSVLEFAPGSAGARDYRRLADAITHLPAIHQASGGLQFFMERLVRQNPGG